MDISQAELLAVVFGRHFSEDEVREILEAGGSSPWKKKLQDNTDKALGLGAFGAPWFLVTNRQGVQEPFFGSDRFHFMWTFLGLPYNDVAIVPKSQL